MKIQLITAFILTTSFFCDAQVVNFAPNANTIIISTNTTVGIGGGNFKTYLVCPGVTLSYAESSTMDTILLEAGATLKFDSTMSYGYASVYAKNGANVDMNFRQTGKLTYSNGVTILDTNIGPPSFFMGKQLVNTINYIYANLPGGVGCAPNSLNDIEKNNFLTIGNNSNQLSIFLAKGTEEIKVKLVNSVGQILLRKNISQLNEIIDISQLPAGLYHLVWSSNKMNGSKSFVK